LFQANYVLGPELTLFLFQGGVAWLDPEYQPPAELTLTENLPLLARHIAGQPHNNGGKTTRAYHAITRGWYLNELMRRTRGISHGQRLIELGHELGIRVYCGLPKEADQFHCQVYDSDLRKLVNKLMPDLPGSPSWKSLHQSQPKPKNPSPTEDGINSNNFDILRGQSPSGFTVTNAHAMATLAGIMANRGTLREKRYISPQVWDRAHILETENADQKDLVIGLKFNYLHGGNVLSNEGTTWPQCIIDYTDPAKPKIARFPKLSKAEEFRWTGWFGLGGSHIQWNAEHNVSSGYAPNLLEPGGLGMILWPGFGCLSDFAPHFGRRKRRRSRKSDLRGYGTGCQGAWRQEQDVKTARGCFGLEMLFVVRKAGFWGRNPRLCFLCC